MLRNIYRLWPPSGRRQCCWCSRWHGAERTGQCRGDPGLRRSRKGSSREPDRTPVISSVLATRRIHRLAHGVASW